MKSYAIWIFIFVTFANGALLLGTGCLSNQRVPFWRLVLGSMLSGVYAVLCLVTLETYLNETWVRIVWMVLAGFVAFGRNVSGVLLYLLLSFALEGLVRIVDGAISWTMVFCAFLIFFICVVIIRNTEIKAQFVPVELEFCGRKLKVTALRDTGNFLCDPITGNPVLILGLKASQTLTGLSQRQLQRPVEVMRHPPIHGLRLIPYKTISQANGFILGVQMSKVRVGAWKGKLVVAFAPEEFGSSGEFDALTGGMV